MIRNFFSIAVFFATICLASFGQDVFGRQDIIAWAHVVQEQGPDRVHTAWQLTDRALAEIATQAGTETVMTCTYGDLVWAQRFYTL